jgi:hypothetical protein
MANILIAEDEMSISNLIKMNLAILFALGSAVFL